MRVRPVVIVLLLISLIFLPACAPPGLPKAKRADLSEFSDKPAPLRQGFAILKGEGARNAVLNYDQVGYDAFKLGHIDIAEDLLEKALIGIEAIYATGERGKQAAKARSLWHEEKIKDFKGEAYERVMAYYYRGLVFMRRGDYENARACFMSGLLQDAFAEEKQNRVDFSLMVFLEAWTSMVINPDGEYLKLIEELEKLQTLKNKVFKVVNDDANNDKTVFKKPNYLPLDTHKPKPADNVLIIIETGNGPRKRSDGVEHDSLKFFRGKKFKEVDVSLKIDNGSFTKAPRIEDIYWQANSRGLRPIDSIKSGGVVFKKVTGTIAGILAGVSDIVDTASLITLSEGGLKTSTDLALIGAGLDMLSGLGKVHVDIRYWKNLPDKVFCYTTALPQGSHTLSVQYYDKKGKHLTAMDSTVNFEVNSGKKNLVYVASQERIYSKMSHNEQRNDKY